MNSIKSLIAACGMTQRAFAEYFHVPLRSVENWASGSRQCPEYVAELIEYKAEHEGLIIRHDQLQNSIDDGYFELVSSTVRHMGEQLDRYASEHSEEYPGVSQAIREFKRDHQDSLGAIVNKNKPGH
jgi:hypothetical protein